MKARLRRSYCGPTPIQPKSNPIHQPRREPPPVRGPGLGRLRRGHPQAPRRLHGRRAQDAQGSLLLQRMGARGQQRMDRPPPPHPRLTHAFYLRLSHPSLQGPIRYAANAAFTALVAADMGFKQEAYRAFGASQVGEREQKRFIDLSRRILIHESDWLFSRPKKNQTPDQLRPRGLLRRQNVLRHRLRPPVAHLLPPPRRLL